MCCVIVMCGVDALCQYLKGIKIYQGDSDAFSVEGRQGFLCCVLFECYVSVLRQFFNRRQVHISCLGIIAK